MNKHVSEIARSVRRIVPDEILKVLGKLVSTPSIAGKEDEIARFISSYFSDLGFQVESVPTPGCGPTIVAKFSFNKRGSSLLLYGHGDTVEPCMGWRDSPFKPTIKENRLYGLGSYDMKGGLTAIMVAAKTLRELPLKGTVVVAIASDEEGFSRGCDALIRSNKLAEIDGAISVEPTDLDSVLIGRRGRMVYDVEVKGKPAHGAEPKTGVNAIEVAARIVSSLKDLKPGSHPRMGEGSITTLKIQGGTRFLSVPGECRILIDRHIVLGEDRKEAIQQLEHLIRRLKLRAQTSVKLMSRPTPFMDPYETDARHPIVRAVIDACRSVVGFEPKLGYGLSVADENYLATRANIPTITFGPKGGNAHSANEYVEIDSVVNASKIITYACHGFLTEYA